MIPSIYEVVTRPNKPAASWENPENPQHQQAFVSLYDDIKGAAVANKGLHEYEILGDDTIRNPFSVLPVNLALGATSQHQKRNACGNLRLNMQ